LWFFSFELNMLRLNSYLINSTVQRCSCDDCVVACYCVFRYTYSSFLCFGHAWSTVRVLLSYVNLTLFKSIKQCLCIKFHEKIGKITSLTYQMMHIIFRMKQRLRVEFLHGSRILKSKKCLFKSDEFCGCLSAVEIMDW
jgi:hypothetical protein